MPEKEIKKILLRIPPDLWEQIQRMADAEFRSINGQMEYLLREAVKKRTEKTKG